MKEPENIKVTCFATVEQAAQTIFFSHIPAYHSVAGGDGLVPIHKIVCSVINEETTLEAVRKAARLFPVFINDELVDCPESWSYDPREQAWHTNSSFVIAKANKDTHGKPQYVVSSEIFRVEDKFPDKEFPSLAESLAYVARNCTDCIRLTVGATELADLYDEDTRPSEYTEPLAHAYAVFVSDWLKKQHITSDGDIRADTYLQYQQENMDAKAAAYLMQRFPVMEKVLEVLETYSPCKAECYRPLAEFPDDKLLLAWKKRIADDAEAICKSQNQAGQQPKEQKEKKPFCR